MTSQRSDRARTSFVQATRNLTTISQPAVDLHGDLVPKFPGAVGSLDSRADQAREVGFSNPARCRKRGRMSCATLINDSCFMNLACDVQRRFESSLPVETIEIACVFRTH